MLVAITIKTQENAPDPSQIGTYDPISWPSHTILGARLPSS